MRQMILNRTPFFGNDDPYADQIAVRVFDDLYDAIEGKPNTKGECFHLNMLSTTCHVYFGKVMGATPNGRLAGRAISDGTSPSHGADTHGPSAVVKSLGKLDQVKSGGTLLNQRFLPSLLRREEDISKLASLIRSYFALGGHHIQFNIVDTETLYAAQKCPEADADEDEEPGLPDAGLRLHTSGDRAPTEGAAGLHDFQPLTVRLNFNSIDKKLAEY